MTGESPNGSSRHSAGSGSLQLFPWPIPRLSQRSLFSSRVPYSRFVGSSRGPTWPPGTVACILSAVQNFAACCSLATVAGSLSWRMKSSAQSPLTNPSWKPQSPHRELTLFEPRLIRETAAPAAGFLAVCMFANNRLGTQVLTRLAQQGVRVPARSPNAVAEHIVDLILSLNHLG